MRKSLLTAATIAALALGGCQMSVQQQNELGGALAGAAVGLIGAKAFGADDGWVLMSAAAGAAAGVMIARNQQTGQCAYSNGDGTYTQRPCT